MLLWGTMFNIGQNSKFDLFLKNKDIIENSPSMSSAVFSEMLEKTDLLNLIILDYSENITRSINEKSIQRLLIIPSGFHDSVSTGRSANIILKSVPPEVDSASAAVKNLINQIVDRFNTNTALQPIPKIVTIESQEIISKAFGFIDFFVPGLIGMTIMTTGVSGALGLNTKNRELGILKKLATTPLSKIEWIVGVVLYEFVMSAISTVAILLIGVLVFDLRAFPNIYSLILIISGAIAFPGLGMVIACFVKESDSVAAATNTITIPMMFLSGTFFPLETMPSFLAQIARVLPLTYLNNGLKDSMVYNNIPNAFFNTAIVFDIGIFFIIIGVLATNWREQ
jgi:ABC-2 type transport system permease protein